MGESARSQDLTKARNHGAEASHWASTRLSVLLSSLGKPAGEAENWILVLARVTVADSSSEDSKKWRSSSERRVLVSENQVRNSSR